MIATDPETNTAVAAYAAAHPDAARWLYGAAQYFTRNELLAILLGAKGREIEFEAKHGGPEDDFREIGATWRYVETA